MGEFQVPDRDELIANWKRDAAFRAPDVDIGAAQVDIDAGVAVDAVLPIFAKSQEYAKGTTLDGLTFEELQDEADDLGLPKLLPAVGAIGFVTIDASTGGTTITAGQEAIFPSTRARYYALETKLYFNGENVAVAARATGVSTDLDAGTVLQWDSPPPGLGLNAVVFEQSDGTGLTGGREQETRQELIDRIREARRNPAASGNDASYAQIAKRTPAVGIQFVGTHPAIEGPGTSALAFLVRPSKLGGNRKPSNAAIGQVRGFVTGQMPRDDSVSYLVVLSNPVDVVLKVAWAKGVASWTDGVPWPPEYVAGDQYEVDAAAITPSGFTVTTASGSPVSPQAGQTIALFDRANLRFVSKRILTVTGTGPWVLAFDMTNNASDLSYVPVAGDLVSPWSASLNLIPSLIASYFEGLGTGENLNTFLTPFFDDGFRQRRSPANEQEYPYIIGSKITDGIEDLPAVSSVTPVAPVLPYRTPDGVLGVSVNLSELAQLAIYPA